MMFRTKSLLQKRALALISIMVLIVAASYGVYQNYTGLTVVSISQIYVDPQGSEVANEWAGSFWNMLVSLQINNEDVAGVVLPENQSSSITYHGVTETLKTGAKIEIKIDPEQPYLIRNLQEKTVRVTAEAPRTYSTISYTNIGQDSSVKAGELNLNYYEWSEPSFRIYTPFTVSIYKDGVLVGQRTLNMEGADSVQTVDTGEGTVRIENLGILQSTYLAPNTPAQLAIIKGYPYMYDWTQINGLVNYDSGASYTSSALGLPIKFASGTQAYSTYWYGNTRWSNNNQPCAIINSAHDLLKSVGGWSYTRDGITEGCNPNKPVVGSADKSVLPSDKQSYMSLLEYIESKNVQNLAESSIFNKYEGLSFVTDSSGKVQSLKIKIPLAAYGTPLINIRIPTELADTFVDRPPISNGKIACSWEGTGSKYADISGSQRIKVLVTQESTVKSGVKLVASCSNSKVGIYPLYQGIANLEPGQTVTAYFDISNLGVETKESNIPITISAYETYGGTKTSEATVYATLLPTLSHGVTTVNIQAVEKQNGTAIQGLQIQVIYPATGESQTKQGFTAANGKIQFTLDYSAGGAFTGQAIIQSVETTKYLATQKTVTISSPSIYEFTLEVPLKSIEYPDEGGDGVNWTLIAVVLVVAAFASVLIFSFNRKKSKTKTKFSLGAIGKVAKLKPKRKASWRRKK